MFYIINHTQKTGNPMRREIYLHKNISKYWTTCHIDICVCLCCILILLLNDHVCVYGDDDNDNDDDDEVSTPRLNHSRCMDLRLILTKL
jgi:hypothetical protein